MWKRVAFFVIVVGILFNPACSTQKQKTSTDEVSRITVVFDGSSCQVSGHEVIETKLIYFDGENQSNKPMTITITEIKEGRTAEEVYRSFTPGSTEFPDGSMLSWRLEAVMAGSSDTRHGVMMPGEHVLLCEIFGTFEKYYGAIFFIPE